MSTASRGGHAWVYGPGYRAVELALVAIPAALAAILTAALVVLRRRPVLEWVWVEGAAGRCFRVYGLDAASRQWPAWLRHLPGSWAVLRGDLALVGPRLGSPVLEGQEGAGPRPGLVPLHALRHRCNLAFGSEEEHDRELVEVGTPWYALGTLLRTLPWLPLGSGVAGDPRRGSILGVNVDTLRVDEAIGRILAAACLQERLEVCFVNADCVNLACRDHEYRSALNHADLCLPDGVGVRLAGTALGLEIRENTNGTDLFPRLCAALEETGLSLFLLGARPGVAHGVRSWIETNHPGVQVAGVHHGYFGEDDVEDVVTAVRNSGADIVLTALGAPRQELWNAAYLADTGASVALGVGGLFDFYSGRIPRAPLWLRELGLEWAYRLLQEPRRMWRRYVVGNAVFLGRVAAARLRPQEAS